VLVPLAYAFMEDADAISGSRRDPDLTYVRTDVVALANADDWTAIADLGIENRAARVAAAVETVLDGSDDDPPGKARRRVGATPKRKRSARVRIKT
jgi:hypothetical protein